AGRGLPPADRHDQRSMGIDAEEDQRGDDHDGDEDRDRHDVLRPCVLGQHEGDSGAEERQQNGQGNEDGQKIDHSSSPCFATRASSATSASLALRASVCDSTAASAMASASAGLDASSISSTTSSRSAGVPSSSRSMAPVIGDSASSPNSVSS